MAHGPISTSATCAVPAPTGGFLSGDFLVAHVFVAFNDFYSVSTAIAPSEAGWTSAAQDAIDVDPAGQRLAVFYRFSTGVEPANYTFNWGADGGSVLRLLAYRGVDPSNPIVNTAVRRTGPNDSVTALTNSVTTTVANTRILCCFGAAQSLNIKTFTDPSADMRVYTNDNTGYVGARNTQIGTGNPQFPSIMLTGEIVQTGVGPSGTKSATIDMTDASSRIVMAHAMGLNPKQF